MDQSPSTQPPPVPPVPPSAKILDMANTVKPVTNTVDCKTCGQQVSKTAMLCPHCGQIIPSPNLRRVFLIAGCVFAGVVALVLVSMWIGNTVAEHQQEEVRKVGQDIRDRIYRENHPK
jgi:predicted RNA-binding Zn-ribbon protein involved in translation (DUF1610 family)